jgi:putative nucleotidyltransferase with HDIG domain
MNRWPEYDEALEMLHEWTENPNLRKHAYAVEDAMRAYAGHFGEDEEKWAIVGLLHDFDYERHPGLDEHPYKGAAWLREQGFAEDLVEGVLAHAEHTMEPRDTRMKKAIFAVDELTGLIVAVALVRPSKKLADVSVESVMKKWPEQRFAAGVDREQVEKGASELGVPLEQHVRIVLKAMQKDAERLGL